MLPLIAEPLTIVQHNACLSPGHNACPGPKPLHVMRKYDTDIPSTVDATAMLGKCTFRIK
jgi:hypothetical protein